jgi:UDP-hydrolysing UDP-N-acetyl-D-glucosamine 2-epimerase
MKKKRKVCIVVASRANYGRIKSVLKAVNDHPDLDLMLVVGASALLYRFGKVIDLIQRDGFEVTATAYCIVEGENPTTMAKSTGLAIQELTTIFENYRPDVVVSVADRFETIATAIAATYMNIPLAHTQGGEVTGSIDECVRHAVTRLAHIHFPATELSADRLVKMGEDPARIFMVGCPSIDVIASLDLSLPADIFSRYGGVGVSLNLREPYIVVLQHPVTTEYGRGFEQINETLMAVDAVGIQTVWLWPNVDAGSDDVSKGLRMFREKYPYRPIHFYRNFSVEDYARLINNGACIVGNSSSAIREGSFLGVPAVNIGTRQNGRERGGNVIDVPYEAAAIRAAIERQLAHGRYPRSALFGDGRAGLRIAQILSEVDFSIEKRLAY